MHLGVVEFTLSDGTVLAGPVHQANLEGDAGTPLASVLDLASAYKQFALSPKCRMMSIVTLKDPASNQCKCFEGRVLPFGATASVVHFNRIARFCKLWGSNA